MGSGGKVRANTRGGKSKYSANTKLGRRIVAFVEGGALGPYSETKERRLVTCIVGLGENIIVCLFVVFDCWFVCSIYSICSFHELCVCTIVGIFSDCNSCDTRFTISMLQWVRYIHMDWTSNF